MTLNTVEKQKIKEVIECLESSNGRTRLEKLEELISEWMKFWKDDYDDEDGLLQAMIEHQRRKEKMKIVEKEWHAVWLLKKVQKRRGIEHFQ